MHRVSRLTPALSLCALQILAVHSPAQPPQPQKPPEQPDGKLPALLAGKPLPEDPKDDELRRLLKARYNEALREAQAYYHESRQPFRAVRGNPDDLYGPWQRLVQAGLELYDKPSERVALLIRYADATMETEKVEQERYANGRIPASVLHRARYQRLDAEIQLLRAKREADKAKDK